MHITDLKTFTERFRLGTPDPSSRTLTKRQVVEHIQPHILKLRRWGYSWASIADYLATFQVNLSVTTLRAYIQRSQKLTSRRDGAIPDDAEQTP